MAIRISSQIAPLNDAQAIYTHEDIFGKGGFVAINTQGISGSTASERIDNIITPARRKTGMLVYDVHTNFYYRREENSWTQEDFGGGTDTGASTLGALTDVDLTSGVSAGNLIRFNGTSWIPFDIDSEFVKFTDLPQTTDGSLDIAQESSLNNLIDLVNSLDLSGNVKGIEAGNGIIVEELTDSNFRISLDPETILEIPQVLGGTGINVTVTTNEDFLVSVDSTIATLTGFQNLTNKTVNGLSLEDAGGQQGEGFRIYTVESSLMIADASDITFGQYGQAPSIVLVPTSGDLLSTQWFGSDNQSIDTSSAQTGDSLVYDGSTSTWVPVAISGGSGGTDGISGAPTTSKFVTWGSEPFLENDRVLTAGNNISLNINGTDGQALISLSTVITGLTSITSTTFVGSLTGNASSATNISGGDPNQILFQKGSSGTDFVVSPTATNQILSSGSTIGAWAWLDTTGTGNIIRASELKSNISDLNDVTFSNLQEGNILVYDGTQGWINSDIIFGGNASSFTS